MMGMGSIRGILSPLLVYYASPPAYCRGLLGYVALSELSS